MKSWRTLLLVLAFAVASAGCQPPVQEAGPLSEEDVASIRGVFDSLMQAERASDWDGLAALLAEDAIMMMPGQPTIEGLPPGARRS
ncbi:MAG: nuclear transport factor 2 family protein [Gemmatimonadales bacterium]|jgi:hypothetical protein